MSGFKHALNVKKTPTKTDRLPVIPGQRKGAEIEFSRGSYKNV
jgi:hypothetical protein